MPAPSFRKRARDRCHLVWLRGGKADPWLRCEDTYEAGTQRLQAEMPKVLHQERRQDDA